MSNEFNFGGGMQDFGREVMRELIKTDYGPECSFNGIEGHGMQDHHGGSHDQINLFQEGVKDSGITFRFFENK
jgi:hypothetical protein